jgi:hypothetical protein
MKLSEAIRLGAMLRPQAFGGFFKDQGGGVIGSCALAAALEAIGWKPLSNTSVLIRSRGWPGEWTAIINLMVSSRSWPGGEIYQNCWMQLGNVISILNDVHWSREDIASFVENIEDRNPELYPAPQSECSDVSGDAIDIRVHNRYLHRIEDRHAEDAVPAHAERHPHDSVLVGAGRGIP